MEEVSSEVLLLEGRSKQCMSREKQKEGKQRHMHSIASLMLHFTGIIVGVVAAAAAVPFSDTMLSRSEE
jgi:hypothetical protein